MKGSAKKIFNLLKLLTLPYQIGFVRGQFYLTNHQILQIQKVLKSDNNREIVTEYEQRMAALIGPGCGISFAAGRMAFFSLLKILNVGVGDEVVLPGFTCSVMPNAVWRTGATPVFTDIDIETFGSDAEEIEKKITSRTKVIVAQHSFGIPCNISKIVDLGKKYGVFVIEDCAITLDSSVKGVKAGNWGDAAIFSTDHSKPLNTLVGGFLYTKNKSIYQKARSISAITQHLDKAHQERLYKQFLFEYKNYTPENYPKAVFINYVRSALKTFGSKHQLYTFFEADYTKEHSSCKSYPYPAKMPSFLAQIGLFELGRWEEERKRRRDLLKKYLKITEQLGFDKHLPKAYFDSELEIVPSRFVFTHPDSERLLKLMSKFIDIGWTWFRSPIICTPEGPEGLGYKLGSCPNAENVGQNIINWPCVLPENWDSKILNIFQAIINGRKSDSLNRFYLN